jgi:ribonuclease HI
MIEIYTDGAYSSSRNQGGWAFVVIEDNKEIFKKFGSALNTTNNRMEIMACLEALRYSKGKEVKIFSDSMYVIGTMTKNWKKRKNTDLWIAMEESLSSVQVIWEHVKGHAGNKWNELCDLLAVHGSQINLKE